MESMSQKFTKEETLKSEKLIKQLFEEGQSVNQFPLRLIYLKTTYETNIVVKSSVSVSKRNFKKAVDRNRIKRLLREAYRLQKPVFFNNTNHQYALMILYIGKEIPDFDLINSKLKHLFGKLSAIIAKEQNIKP